MVKLRLQVAGWMFWISQVDVEGDENATEAFEVTLKKFCKTVLKKI